MKKYIYFLLFIIFAAELQAHTDHYKGIVKIEMDVLRNGEIVGYSNYFFEYNDNTTVVKNYTKFKVIILGKSFLRRSSFSFFVPVAKTLPPNKENFLTKALPIPPVAPVIKIFLLLKLIIQIYFF